MNALGGIQPERRKLHLNFGRTRAPTAEAALRMRTRELEEQLAAQDRVVLDLMRLLGRADRELAQVRAASAATIADIAGRAIRAEAVVHAIIREDDGRCFAMGEQLADFVGVPA